MLLFPRFLSRKSRFNLSLFQATLREANRLLSEQGAPPLVDIGGIVSDTAASAAAIAKRSNAAEAAVADVPQPVHAGAKKLAAAPPASVTSKAPPPAPAAAGKAVPRADMRAKTPSTTFLTGGEFDGEDDELAKASDGTRCHACAACDAFVRSLQSATIWTRGWWRFRSCSGWTDRVRCAKPSTATRGTIT